MKKSDYEKLRDINIAERQKALRESGLLKEISKYKKEFLGKGKKVGLPADSTRSAVKNRVKMSQCRHCQEKVPSGMMVLHKKYFHSQTMEQKVPAVAQHKTVITDLVQKCPKCYANVNPKMMNMHMKRNC